MGRTGCNCGKQHAAAWRASPPPPRLRLREAPIRQHRLNVTPHAIMTITMMTAATQPAMTNHMRTFCWGAGGGRGGGHRDEGVMRTAPTLGLLHCWGFPPPAAIGLSLYDHQRYHRMP
jgi:hypothetical protein